MRRKLRESESMAMRRGDPTDLLVEWCNYRRTRMPPDDSGTPAAAFGRKMAPGGGEQ